MPLSQAFSAQVRGFRGWVSCLWVEYTSVRPVARGSLREIQQGELIPRSPPKADEVSEQTTIKGIHFLHFESAAGGLQGASIGKRGDP
jgi:hypothetical protein